MELASPLARVLGSLRCDIGSPQGALDVGETGGVRAGVTWVKRWVPLEVDVESSAEIYSVAKLLTLDGVVCLKSVETQVGVGIAGSIQVFKAQGVALRSGCSIVCSVLYKFVSGCPASSTKLLT